MLDIQLLVKPDHYFTSLNKELYEALAARDFTYSHSSNCSNCGGYLSPHLEILGHSSQLCNYCRTFVPNKNTLSQANPIQSEPQVYLKIY